MKIERIKEIQAETAYPNSRSVQHCIKLIRYDGQHLILKFVVSVLTLYLPLVVGNAKKAIRHQYRGDNLLQQSDLLQMIL